MRTQTMTTMTVTGVVGIAIVGLSMMIALSLGVSLTAAVLQVMPLALCGAVIAGLLVASERHGAH